MTLILSGTEGLSDIDGSAATPAIRGTDANTGIFFPAADTLAFAEGGAEVARFDSSGNFGIGTTTPDDITSGYTTVDVRGSTGGGLRLGVAAGNNMAIYASATTSVIEAAGSAALQLVVNSAERARIDSSGNLLVGTTSALAVASKTQISSAASIAYFYTSSTGNDGCYVDIAGNNKFFEFRKAGVEKGSISTNGTNTTYATSSDYRLKNTIAPMTGALAKVALLKPCTYKWNIDDSDGQGFIAHELDEVVSGCVTGAKDAVDAEGNPQYQGIDTSFLVATLTAAIQEQQALITALTTRITALEGAAA
jgi:hypothetical protein